MAGKKRIGRIVVGAIGALLCLCLVAAGIYLGGYYRADATAQTALASDATVTVQVSTDYVVFQGPDEDTENTRGLVYYPGANVEFTAYAPLLHALAADGWQVVLVKMPLNHAFTNIGAATAAMEKAPQVERWFVGGHSLGGAMAALYAADNVGKLDGLILLAAFSTADLSNSDLEVFSIYGSEDGVLGKDSYAKYWTNLPETAQELVIAGGNHAQFGSYGAQNGDGAAIISAQEQVAQTVAFLHAA